MPAPRTHRVLEWLTQQSTQAQATPEYGSWLLGGRVSESQRRRRIRIQLILTVFVVVANLIGVAVAMSVITVAIRCPTFFAGRAHLITTVVAPGLRGRGGDRRLGVGHPAHPRRIAVVHRGPPADRARSAQHVPRPRGS